MDPLEQHPRLRELVRAFAASTQRPDDYVAELEAALEGALARWNACRAAGQADFFGFIVHGHAALESVCYAAYAVGATYWPQVFPFGSDAARRAVGLRSTARAHDLAGNAAFAAQLNGLLDSAAFRSWSRYRNILTHRALGPDPELTPAAVAGMERWLGGALRDLLGALVAMAEAQPVRSP